MQKSKYKVVHYYGGGRQKAYYMNDLDEAFRQTMAIAFNSSSTMYELRKGKFVAVRNIKKRVL